VRHYLHNTHLDTRSLLKILMSLTLLFLSMSVLASEIRAWPAPDCTGEPQIKPSNDPGSLGGKVDESNLTIFGINVPKNKMNDIRDPLPKPIISDDNPGCASCSDYACYLSKEKTVALIFYKYTAWDLQGFEITTTERESLPKTCVHTNLDINEFKTKSGIGIGSSKDLISNRLNVKNPTGKLLFHYRIKLNQKQIADALRGSMSIYEPKCDDFYIDATTEITVNYNKDGLSEYKVNYMEMF